MDTRETGNRAFVVYGEPFGKQRPKASVFGGHAHVYTPKKTATYESYVRDAYLSGHSGSPVIDGAFSVSIKAVFGHPKGDFNSKGGLNKRGREKEASGCLKKPDCDNIAKIILDPLNGVAFRDDSGCVSLTVTKEYGPTPMVEVLIRPISGRKWATEED
jgi:Holliday junction resolvase RusA-like endonuclease